MVAGDPAPSPSRRRVLVATDDVLTERLAGPAIRAWHVAGALAPAHDVVLATTSGTCAVRPRGFRAEAADEARFAELEAWCEVAVIQGYLLHKVPGLRRSRRIMAFDLYDPLQLEALELTRGMAEPERSIHVGNSVGTVEEQLARGDVLFCASERQRDFWLGSLTALGRVNPRTYGEDPTLRRLIDVVPFGLPDEPPVHTRPALRGVVPGIGPGDEVVVWGGGLYDWFDPVTLVRAVDRLRATRPALRLVFMGMRHPKPDIAESAVALEARRLAAELGLTGVHVFFNEGWVPYEERQNHLLEADVAVSLHHVTVETRFSFRTRVLDYLWAGLPMVLTTGDGFADLVRAEGLGRVVPDADPGAVAEALGELLADPAERAACRERARALSPRFAWSAALAPVVAFCADPRPAPDDPQWRPPTPRPGPGGGPADDPGAPVGGPPEPGWRRDLRRVRALYLDGGVRAVAGDTRRWLGQRLGEGVRGRSRSR
ncbi:MAG TPA: glycosyltransferase [Acidimicrobiales bacterium]|nr:glycosyltransferase [Acidimicrobiales bacterium]